MYTDIESFFNSLDFENNHYFYHVTEKGNGDSIIEKGLYVEGTNIINTNNLLFTTAIELKQEDLTDFQDFIDFLEENSFVSHFRDTTEIVFIASPKELDKKIVLGCDQIIDDTYYRGIIPSEHIVGYINVTTKEITTNEDCEYIVDPFFL